MVFTCVHIFEQVAPRAQALVAAIRKYLEMDISKL